MEKERWKPKQNQKFWYINFDWIECDDFRMALKYDYCTSDTDDHSFNCFRTKELALNTLKTIKGILGGPNEEVHYFL